MAAFIYEQFSIKVFKLTITCVFKASIKLIKENYLSYYKLAEPIPARLVLL